MKSFIVVITAIFVLLSMHTVVFATSWPDNYGWRVLAMGGADLAIEDETTELNLFNFGNPAGMAYLPKVNRLDFGIQAKKRIYKEIDITRQYMIDPLGHRIPIANRYETYRSEEIQIDRNTDGGNYRGLIVWILNNLAMRVDISGWNHWSDEEYIDRFIPELSIPTFDLESVAQQEEYLSLLGSGLDLSWEIIPNLSIGGRAKYYTPATTDNYSIEGLWLWTVSAAYRAPIALLEKSGITFGLVVGSDDEDEDFKMGITESKPITNSIWPDARSIRTQIHKAINDPNKFQVGAEILANVGKNVSVGVVSHYKDRRTKSPLFEEVDTITYIDPSDPANNYTQTTYSSYQSENEEIYLRISPVFKCRFNVTEDLKVLVGWRVSNNLIGDISTKTYRESSPTTSTYGDGTVVTTTSDIYDEDFIYVGSIEDNEFAFGLGTQALNKQLQFAFQYQSQRHKKVGEGGITTEAFDTDTIRLGGEVWIVPFIALRGGYVWNWVDVWSSDVTLNDSEVLTAGLGFVVSEMLTINASGAYAVAKYPQVPVEEQEHDETVLVNLELKMKF